MNVVRAGVRAAGLMGGPLHACFRNQVAEEIKFAGAGLWILVSNGPDGAVVQVDSKVPVGDGFEVGEVTLFIE